jgi:leucyl-tRNA synthetase
MKTICKQKALAYWESVDLYIGGNEHATGHLFVLSFLDKFLKTRFCTNGRTIQKTDQSGNDFWGLVLLYID